VSFCLGCVVHDVFWGSLRLDLTRCERRNSEKEVGVVGSLVITTHDHTREHNCCIDQFRHRFDPYDDLSIEHFLPLSIALRKHDSLTRA
jgi:hypothetical protein